MFWLYCLSLFRVCLFCDGVFVFLGKEFSGMCFLLVKFLFLVFLSLEVIVLRSGRWV